MQKYHLSVLASVEQSAKLKPTLSTLTIPRIFVLVPKVLPIPSLDSSLMQQE